jgi:hypothetical protein
VSAGGNEYVFELIANLVCLIIWLTEGYKGRGIIFYYTFWASWTGCDCVNYWVYSYRVWILVRFWTLDFIINL